MEAGEADRLCTGISCHGNTRTMVWFFGYDDDGFLLTFSEEGEERGSRIEQFGSNCLNWRRAEVLIFCL